MKSRVLRNISIEVTTVDFFSSDIAIENGLRFAIREGGRTVGSGVVIGINE